MDLLLLAIRIGLAGVLLTASFGKLIDIKNPAGREAMEAFGVPAHLAPAAAIVLPVVELLLGILLLPIATAWWAGLGTFLLMLVFIAGIARQIAQGNSPDCHCFGQLHSAPAGPRTLIRNGIFAAAAAILVLFGWNDPGTSIGGWFSDRTGIELTLLIVSVAALGGVAALAWIILQLMSQAGRMLNRIEALEGALGIDPDASEAPATSTKTATTEPVVPTVGSIAPDFTLPDLAGQPVSLASLCQDGLPVMLVFTSPSCTPCTKLMPDIAKWQRDGNQRLRTVVVSRGDRDVNIVKTNDAGVTGVLLQPEREISTMYGANSTPSAVVVMSDGRIGSALARGATAVRALADAQLSAPAVAAPAPTPEPSPARALAPAIALPTLDTPDVPSTLATLGVGKQPIVLFFTDPRCDPCDELLPELLAWQREVGDRARIALVSRGDADDNRKKAVDYGLTGVIPVLMQQDMETISAYGVLQAPATVLIGRDGSWDGTPAYGDLAIRTLLKRALSPESTVPTNGNAPAPVRPEIGEGDAVPEIALPDLAGEPTRLIDPETSGTDRVLLFWRANCGYCQRMLPQLKEWEATRAADSPELVVISTSQVPEMVAQGFESRVVLDHGVNVGRRFGSRGTPSAVRVGADGTVIAPIASGAQAVLQLIEQTTATTSTTRG
ncbi:MAG: redoxin domain-containing protein [Thermomicrobiales bacterium]